MVILTYVAKHLPLFLFRAHSPCAGWPHHPCSRWVKQWKYTAFGLCSWTRLSQGVRGLKARGWWMSQQMQCYLLLDQPQAVGASQHHLSGKKPAPGAQGGWNCVYIKKGGLSYTSDPSTRAKYLKGREEALWGTSALTKTSCVLASEDNHGDPGKSGIIFYGTSPPPHCLWGKNSLGCFVDGVIYSPNTYCFYLYGYLLCSKEKQWKIINPGGPVLSRKINKEFSLLCFQVREERTIFITTDSSLPWSRKVFLYILQRE